MPTRNVSVRMSSEFELCYQKCVDRQTDKVIFVSFKSWVGTLFGTAQ